jgi:hypothetical protein
MDENETTTNGPLPPVDKEQLDAGAFVGHERELAVESIPGGLRRDDQRVAAYASQSDAIANAKDIPEEERGWPEGHREINATDDDVRRAGENR